MHILLTEEFAQAVDDHLAAFEPERMMHALGRMRPDGSILLSHWALDAEADASGAHVKASTSGERAMQEVEQRYGVQYFGVIHSHPRTVPDPSGQDGRAVEDLLALNPHLPAALVGVVVATTTTRRGPTVLNVGRGELVIHALTAASGQPQAATLGIAEESDFYAAASRRLPAGALATVNEAHAVIIGCGSLGSVVAEQLVRAGVPRLTVIDPDIVEAHNLTRTVFTANDVGTAKVDALAARLKQINGAVHIEANDWAVDPSAHSKLADIVSDADVVVGAADAPQALAIIDVILHEQQTPGVFAGVYAGAIGADIVTVLPGITACYRCTVAPRVQSAALNPDMDYTTGRLTGAVALGVDVAVVATLTARMAMGVLGLLRDNDTLLDTVAYDGRNFLQLGLAPGFFDDTTLFQGSAGQHAFQTMWARAQGDPDCHECAEATHTGVDDVAAGTTPVPAATRRMQFIRDARAAIRPLARASASKGIAFSRFAVRQASAAILPRPSKRNSRRDRAPSGGFRNSRSSTGALRPRTSWD